ncbi:MAG: hypothetical protein Q8S20_00925 [Sulfuritalea sp.]|nr:hypothetical protein [Sulfuritalea sp.]
MTEQIAKVSFAPMEERPREFNFKAFVAPAAELLDALLSTTHGSGCWRFCAGPEDAGVAATGDEFVATLGVSGMNGGFSAKSLPRMYVPTHPIIPATWRRFHRTYRQTAMQVWLRPPADRYSQRPAALLIRELRDKLRNLRSGNALSGMPGIARRRWQARAVLFDVAPPRLGLIGRTDP